MSGLEIPPPNPRKPPLQANVFHMLRSSNTALAPLFPYAGEGDLVPAPSIFWGGPNRETSVFNHRNSVDEGLHLALYVLGFSASGFGGKAFEDRLERAKRLPRKPFKRKVALDLLTDRWTSPWISLALDRAEAASGPKVS